MTLIAHISDLHISTSEFNQSVFLESVDEINDLKPDMILLTGDITNQGYYKEYQKSKELLSLFKSPLYAVPGNHDARNLGYKTFEEFIGERSWKLIKNDHFVVIGIDSSSPDVDHGNIGRPQQVWMEDQLRKSVNNNFTIVALHHHVIPVPNTGRERNVLSDAGDILKSFVDFNVDLVIAGHRHVHNVWKMNNTLFINAGSLSSNKLRGKDPNSYNFYDISGENIDICYRDIGKKTVSRGSFKKKGSC